MYYVRQKKTGLVSKVVAKPYLGQNSAFEELTEEQFLELSKPKAKAAPAKKKRRRKKKAATPEVNDELTGGVSDDAEDSS